MLDLLNVLGRLIALEPQQAALLDEILGGKLIDGDRFAPATAAAMPVDDED